MLRQVTCERETIKATFALTSLPIDGDKTMPNVQPSKQP